MTDTQIVLQGFRQVFRNFVPGMVVVGIGLIYAVTDGGRGKDERRSRKSNRNNRRRIKVC